MFQFFFLTKKYLKKTSIPFLIFLLNAIIRNIKIHNIFNIIEISKSMERNKCTHLKKILWKYLFKCFLWFFKVRWVYEIKVWWFLVVPPKETLTHKPDSIYVKETLKDCLCDTLKELKTKISNEEGLKKATLQCDEVLECLKATNGHVIKKVLKRHQSLLHGSLVFTPSTPSSSYVELYFLCLTLMLH
jgi:hypothetical protein